MSVFFFQSVDIITNLTSEVTSTGCLKKSFAALKAYINLFRGHVQHFELS
jgi:hypothetical protein